jgi:peptidoglycan-associated lipoprotein
MSRALKVLLVVSLGALLAGCPKKPTTVPDASQGDSVAATTDTAGRGYSGVGKGVAEATGTTGATVKIQAIIHFDYDSSLIKPEYASVIAAQARRLASDRSVKLRLEGHTDERGSAEYNIGLGERRAQAVKRALLLEGANEAQLATVSFGSERPMAEGHNEAAWSQNRRVELVDGSR